MSNTPQQQRPPPPPLPGNRPGQSPRRASADNGPGTPVRAAPPTNQTPTPPPSAGAKPTGSSTPPNSVNNTSLANLARALSSRLPPPEGGANNGTPVAASSGAAEPAPAAAPLPPRQESGVSENPSFRAPAPPRPPTQEERGRDDAGVQKTNSNSFGPMVTPAAGGEHEHPQPQAAPARRSEPHTPPPEPVQQSTPATGGGLVQTLTNTASAVLAGTFGNMDKAPAGLFIASAPSDRPQEPSSPTRGGTKSHTVANPIRTLDWRDTTGPSVPVLTPRNSRRQYGVAHTLASAEIKVERQPAPGVSPPRPTVHTASPPHNIGAPKVVTVPGMNARGEGHPQHALLTPDKSFGKRRARAIVTPVLPRDLARYESEMRYSTQTVAPSAQHRHEYHQQPQSTPPYPAMHASDTAPSAAQVYRTPLQAQPMQEPRHRGTEIVTAAPMQRSPPQQQTVSDGRSAHVIASQALSHVDAAQARYSHRRQQHLSNRTAAAPSGSAINAIPTAIPLH